MQHTEQVAAAQQALAHALRTGTAAEVQAAQHALAHAQQQQ